MLILIYSLHVLNSQSDHFPNWHNKAFADNSKHKARQYALETVGQFFTYKSDRSDTFPIPPCALLDPS